jgi:hypothetical protein
MDIGFGKRNIFKAVIMLISAAFIAYSTAGDFFGFPSIGRWETAGVWFAISVFIGVILWHFMDMQKIISIHENTRPNVIANGIQLETPFHLFRGGKPAEILERYYIVFRNVKEKGITLVDTQPVHSMVFILDSDCFNEGRLHHEKGFWAGAGEPWNREQDYAVILKASSKPESLCLFVREQGKSELFVFSDDSYISNIRSLEPFQDRLRIPFQKFYMVIRLNAGNLDIDDVFVSVTNSGADQQPRIIILSENPCIGKKL